jgi:hypothetical protein
MHREESEQTQRSITVIARNALMKMSCLGGNEMTTSTIDKPQQTAAKVAGFTYLIMHAIVVYVFFGIHGHLIIKNNAAETARNILAHERLFRIGIAGNVIYGAGVVALLTALYVILKPVNRGLALLAAFWNLVYVMMWLLMTLNLFDAMRLIRGADYLQVFDAERLQALATLYLRTNFDTYYICLLFGGLASTICGYLWFKSRYIPRALAACDVISSAFCVACTFILYIFPNFDKIVGLGWFDSPMGTFNIVLSIWLLFKGLRPSGITESVKTSG